MRVSIEKGPTRLVFSRPWRADRRTNPLPIYTDAGGGGLRPTPALDRFDRAGHAGGTHFWLARAAPSHFRRGSDLQLQAQLNDLVRRDLKVGRGRQVARHEQHEQLLFERVQTLWGGRRG